MPSSSPPAAFFYPPRFGDGLRHRAAGLERLLAALGRRLGGSRGSHGRRPWAEIAPRRHRSGPGGVAAEATAPVPLTGAPIVLLAALPWAFRFQRPQQLARALAHRGHPVLYVEAFDRSRLAPIRQLVGPRSRLPAGVTVLRLRAPGGRDLYRDLPTRAAGEHLAAVLEKGLKRPPGLLLAQLPGWAETLKALARRLPEATTVYDRIDLHTAFPGVPEEMGRVEAELIRAVDRVSATSADLARRSREALQDAGDDLKTQIFLCPNGVDLERFPPALLESERPEGPPAAGFVGALNLRIDTAALAGAARALPGWSFPIAGRAEGARGIAELDRLANVRRLGEIPSGEVPGFLGGLSVGVVPFLDLPITRAVDAVKLYEMFAAGLPVVTRRLDGVRLPGAAWSPPLLYLYDRSEELPALLERARAEDTPELARERRRLAEAESWHHRAETLLAGAGLASPTRS